MLDIKYIRENKAEIKKTIKLKKLKLDLDQLLEIDDKRIKYLQDSEALRAKRNQLNEKIKRAKSQEARKPFIEENTKLKAEVAKVESNLEKIKEKWLDLMVLVPTIPSKDTPIGKDESENVTVKEWGKKPKFDFKPKTHDELAKKLDILDMQRGAKVGGYRGYYLKNEGVLLVMGMMMYALKMMVKNGYTPMIPPTLVKEFCLFGSGYFKGRQYNDETDEIYQIASRDKEASGELEKEKKFLIGTAEPALLAYHSGEILKEEDLPIKYCGFSQCYRSEIGSYGKDTKGHYRVHEFLKVEQVILQKANAKEAEKNQDAMLNISQKMHEELGLPGRRLAICTGDLGTGKYRQFDTEAWLPGMNRYAETGSASIFNDWQSRRLNVKYKTKTGEKKYVYMLNNTALASPRTFIGILENHQQKDGSVRIPKVLQEYVGKEIIKKV